MPRSRQGRVLLTGEILNPANSGYSGAYLHQGLRYHEVVYRAEIISAILQSANNVEGNRMLFETADVYVDFTQSSDIDDLVGVYNSHPAFSRQHLNRTAVTRDWMVEEIKATRNAGFWPCKVGQSTGHVIGLIDVHIDAETYLSLLMVHRSHANQRIGHQVYGALEAYARSHGSCSVRIDVVTGYDNRVLDFWVRNGFHVVEKITLEWHGAKLPAVTMRKALAS